MVGGDTNHGDQGHQPWRQGTPTMATKDTNHVDQETNHVFCANKA